MKNLAIRNQLQQQLPPASLDYCVQLWEQRPFLFELSKRRASKSGDFTCRHGQAPKITVNKDLPPYEFLITYIHEVAHLHVHQKYGFRAEAHGTAWKKAFQELFAPILRTEIFPVEILSMLQKHMVSPKASTYSDTELTKLLRKYDPRSAKITLLSDIPEGSVFDLNGRWFKKGKLQRTRVLCLEVKSKRQFLVPVDVPVGHAQLSFLL
ncbi:MAG: transcription elongation protein SprT [Cyclobacteriaceae bacterium]|nr:transcription elongation protein SprT [Cyclobacteriaceae bacterium]